MLLCGSMRSGAPYLLDACSDSFLSHGILGREIVSSVLGVLTFPCTGLDSVSLICIIHCVGPRCFFSRYLLVYCISLWGSGKAIIRKAFSSNPSGMLHASLFRPSLTLESITAASQSALRILLNQFYGVASTENDFFL